MTKMDGLQSVVMLYNATHRTQISYTGSEPDEALDELVSLLKLKYYELNKTTNITPTRASEIFSGEGFVLENGCAAMLYTSNKQSKVYYYVDNGKQHTFLVVSDAFIVTSASDVLMHSFLRCIRHGKLVTRDWVLDNVENICPLNQKSPEQLKAQELAVAALTLYNATHKHPFSYENEVITSAGVRNLSEDALQDLLSKLSYKTGTLTDTIVKKLSRCKSIRLSQNYVICAYELPESMRLYQMLYREYVVAFVLVGNTVVHNSYVGVCEHIKQLANEGLKDATEWLPEYVREVAAAGENPDYAAIEERVKAQYES